MSFIYEISRFAWDIMFESRVD